MGVYIIDRLTTWRGGLCYQEVDDTERRMLLRGLLLGMRLFSDFSSYLYRVVLYVVILMILVTILLLLFLYSCG